VYLRARLSLMLPAERLADIVPDVPGAGTMDLPEYSRIVPGVPRRMADTSPLRDPLSPAMPMPLAGASNAWAAGVDRSAKGSTLLANDPHLPLSAPSPWYLARLELSSGGVIGGTIPGIPAVLTGRSADLGWAITSSYLDDLDIFVEEVNPANPDEYRAPDGWATKDLSSAARTPGTSELWMNRLSAEGLRMPPHWFFSPQLGSALYLARKAARSKRPSAA
jgi:penicillin amidase